MAITNWNGFQYTVDGKTYALYKDSSNVIGATQTTNKFEILTKGKNLFNGFIIQDTTENGLSIKSTYETITANGTSSNAPIKSYNKNSIKLNKNKTYTFSINKTGTYSGGVCYVSIFDNEGKKIFDNSVSYDFPRSFTGVSEISTLYIWFQSGGIYNNFSMSFQIEEGATATTYEVPKEVKTEISLTEPLRSLPNGIKDTIDKYGVLTRRIGKVVLNGSESGWLFDSINSLTNSIRFTILISNVKQCMAIDCFFSNFPKIDGSTYGVDLENFQFISNNFYIRINKSKLTGYQDTWTDTQKVTALKTWLSANNVTVLYELATPVITNVNKTLFQQSYKDGYIQCNSGVVQPTLDVTYATNVGERLKALELLGTTNKTNIDGLWKVALSLADRELRMKSINLLTTETTTDLKNKLNEILNVWR